MEGEGREKEVTSGGREREREGGGWRRVAQRMAIGVGGMDRGGLVAKGRREYRDTPSAVEIDTGMARGIEGRPDRNYRSLLLVCRVFFFFSRGTSRGARGLPRGTMNLLGMFSGRG